MAGAGSDHPRAVELLTRSLQKDRSEKRFDRLALVSVFGVECGISTYAEMLWPHLSSRFAESHVFAEHGGPELPGVTRCWTRGQPLTELIAAIETYNPRTILIMHEFGHHPEARHWLALIGALSKFRVVVTLHSTYQHRDKSIVEHACPNIVVHTDRQKQWLTEKGIVRPVHVIPHGCLEPAPERLWNLTGTPHSLFSFGFLARYKGLENALEVVAQLKPDFPDIFFTCLCSGAKPNDPYLDHLNGMAKDLGVAEHMGLVPGFASDAVIDSYLRTHSAALFSYKDNGIHTVAGSSGAARVAMRYVPVIGSDAPLFDHLPVARPSTVEGWAKAVAEAFETPDLTEQYAYLQQNSWENVAQRYADVLVDN